LHRRSAGPFASEHASGQLQVLRACAALRGFYPQRDRQEKLVARFRATLRLVVRDLAKATGVREGAITPFATRRALTLAHRELVAVAVEAAEPPRKPRTFGSATRGQMASKLLMLAAVAAAASVAADARKWEEEGAYSTGVGRKRARLELPPRALAADGHFMGLPPLPLPVDAPPCAKRARGITAAAELATRFSASGTRWHIGAASGVVLSQPTADELAAARAVEADSRPGGPIATRAGVPIDISACTIVCGLIPTEVRMRGHLTASRCWMPTPVPLPTVTSLCAGGPVPHPGLRGIQRLGAAALQRRGRQLHAWHA
jgi:hypothetical protein